MQSGFRQGRRPRRFLAGLRDLMSGISALKNTLKALYGRVDARLLPVVAKNKLAARLYYILFSSLFGREQRAVLAGRLAYQQSLQQQGQSRAMLRRNIHRLEKGLIMRPRRAVFGEDYILPTVSCYQKLLTSGPHCDQEMQWAEHVLEDYFAVVANTPVIEQARTQFGWQRREQAKSAIRSAPYQHRDLPPLEVDYHQLYQLFQRRRSVRWFRQEPIDRELIVQAVQAASLAPSACNRQSFRFYLATESARATELAKIAMGTAGFAENIPCLITVVGDLSAYPNERDRHVIYIDGALAAMQLMLALETLGLSSCPINWPDIEFFERRMQKQLKLADYERPVMLIAIGYPDPDGGVAYSQKKSPEQLIKDV